MLNQIYYKSKNYLLSRTKFFTKSRYALPFIFLVCFVEAIIFPFPQEIFMIPMMASEKAKIFKIAFDEFLFKSSAGESTAICWYPNTFTKYCADNFAWISLLVDNKYIFSDKINYGSGTFADKAKTMAKEAIIQSGTQQLSGDS